MNSRRDYSRLEDMLDYARDAVSFMKGDDIDLNRDRLRQLAVIRAVEIVGEAASKSRSRVGTPVRACHGER